MCEIEYEEIDNKEKICEELKNMLFDNEMENKTVEEMNFKVDNEKERKVSCFETIDNDLFLTNHNKVIEKVIEDIEKNEIESHDKLDFVTSDDNNQSIYKLNELSYNPNITPVNENIPLKTEINTNIEIQKYETNDANKNLPITKEGEAPKRLSELYSQFSSSWKERLKAKSSMSKSFTPVIISDNKDSYSDVENSDSEIIAEIPLITSKKPLCADSSSNCTTDEIIVESLSNIKTTEVASFGCGSDSENDTITDISSIPSQKPVFVDSSCDGSLGEIVSGLKQKSKNATVSSFGCSFDSDEIMTPKRAFMKPYSVDSSDSRVSDESFTLATQKRNYNIFSATGSEKDATMVTSSTGTDTTNDIKSEAVFSTQIDETYNNLESKILPFVKSPHTVELRLKGRLSVFQRACVKQIAQEHKLLIKYFGKGKDGYVLLRKKIELLNAQKLFLEMKRNELERKKGKIAQDKAKMERLLNPPMKVSSSCQVDFPDPKSEKNELSKNEARKTRKKQWELKQKQLAKRHSATQTVADGFYLCPYCEGEIPESSQSLHYPFCLSKYRAKMQSQLKSGNIGKDKPSIGNRSKRPVSSDRKNRSKSRDKIQHSTIDTIKKELDKIHDNDINSMVNVLNELSKRCSVSGCNKKKQKTCDDCMVGYCDSHFSPDLTTNPGHFNCPVALERAEAEKQKKLGSNNPLLKTIEELSSPIFPDGALLKRPRRVRIVNGNQPTITTTVNPTPAVATEAQIVSLPPNLNETRTRNGPILNFERNQLHKRLREKIGGFSDRRTK